jgi:hypothetical protein
MTTPTLLWLVAGAALAQRPEPAFETLQPGDVIHGFEARDGAKACIPRNAQSRSAPFGLDTVPSSGSTRTRAK